MYKLLDEIILKCCLKYFIILNVCVISDNKMNCHKIIYIEVLSAIMILIKQNYISQILSKLKDTSHCLDFNIMYFNY